MGPVHDNGAHAYQHVVIDRTTMYEGVMPNGYVVADNGLRAFIGAVNDGAILNIHFITYANAVYIAPYYGIEPNTAIIAHNHIAHDGGIRRNKNITSKLWVNPFNV
jgi:hypothetical protein